MKNLLSIFFIALVSKSSYAEEPLCPNGYILTERNTCVSIDGKIEVPSIGQQWLPGGHPSRPIG